jgi:TM2 domain-containing membrane protein YozV
MSSLLAAGCRWALVLLLAVSLGACQRATYQFQQLAATPYQVPSPALLTDSLPTISGAPVPTPLRAATRPQRKRHSARFSLVGKISQSTRLVKLPRVAATAPIAHGQSKPQPLLTDEPLHHRTRGIAFLLAFFLGGIGSHLFYLGYHKRAVTYLLLTLAGGLLFFIGVVGLLLTLFSSGGGAYAIALLLGAVLLSVVSALAVIDAIRILTDNLKPKDGEYYPRFFQTHATKSPRPD